MQAVSSHKQHNVWWEIAVSSEFENVFCPQLCNNDETLQYSMLSPTVIGVGLHRLGLKSNFGQVEVQRGEAEVYLPFLRVKFAPSR